MPPNLTVLIPCKDEQLHLADCIAAARLVADEVLVADSGSSDRTREIAREAGCRVIEREFGDYSDFKNWALPQAAHPWVLLVDADERVTPELAHEIRKLLAAPPPEIDAYWIRRRNFFLGREIRFSGWRRDKVLRLVRRDVCRYRRRRVHEEFDTPPERTRLLRGRLLHYTVRSYEHHLQKLDRYAAWGALDRWEKGRRASLWGLLVRPFLVFGLNYLLRGGFLDGAAGLQVCMLSAFYDAYAKQARLWELEHAPSAEGRPPQPAASRSPPAPSRSAA